MSPAEIRACYRLYAAHRRSHDAHSLRMLSALRPHSPFCACKPTLKGWRVTSATATPMMTYAGRPSSGNSLFRGETTFECRSHLWRRN
jgi:hypothetical protein